MKIFRQRRANTDSGPVTELSSLLSLLWIHKDAKCVDVRDKIFGLHSFAPVCCRTYIPVDYTCSAFNLCRRLLGHDIQCHSQRGHDLGKEATVRRSLDLHELIIKGALQQIGSKNPLEIGYPMMQEQYPVGHGGTVDSQMADTFKVSGRQCGKVTFVTDPLKSLFVGNGSVRVPSELIRSFQGLNFASEDWEDSDLTASIIKALGYVWGRFSTDRQCTENFNAAKDMGTAGHHFVSLHEDVSAHGLRALMIFVSEFLRTSEFLGTLPVFENCVMFLCRSELECKLGFAPVSTRIGDIVCTFKDTNVIAMVREIEGRFEILGQASRIDLDTTWSPWTGNLLPIEFDLATLQAFSKIAPRYELPDYRIVLTIPPRKREKNSHLGKELSKDAKVLRVTGSRQGKIFVPPQKSENPPYTLPYDSDPPKYLYTQHAAGSSVSEHSPDRPRHVSYTERMYACPRCKLMFATSRDNLRHSSTWSHQQCNKCKCWTSWKSSTSTTSTTEYCTKCRIEDPSCAVDVPDLIVEQSLSPRWFETETTTSSTRSSIRDSIFKTTKLSSTTSTTSDILSMGCDEIEPSTRARPMPSSYTRKHVCDEKCKLFGRRTEFLVPFCDADKKGAIV